ncbi:HPr kinase/phosphatase C-terminal domain-containing protein [Sphingomonas sp. PP-CE-1G-424]|uniref:HPr kinase/phosphorylase n=1 Tax=Sphingomonas sp. PP-CE-1G-424 TaxID=2135658 RepID=UPI001054473D|nr:HPr kinase/phosphatase C-terminal domain-containing protein [Sphingomonas sp. PP-CE-1G-424]TCP67808.1 Hpr(Ser) kinase/phosphatase [Sphingomonas sp. PP-CE-1G-424]
MAIPSSDRLHATSVAIDGVAVLIEGASGSGKSDLALRLIDRGATLISDDQTLVARAGKLLLARAPATIAGRIEVRGIGIVAMPHVDDVPVGLLVRIDGAVERMPERRARKIAGIDVRQFAVDPFHASAPIKVELALRNPEPLT